MNVQQESFDDDEVYVPSKDLLSKVAPTFPNPASIAAGADILATAERPVIIVGRGAMRSGAGDAVVRLASDIGAIIATTLMAKTWLCDQDEYNVGISGLYSTKTAMELFQEADTVIAIGAGLNKYTTEHGYLYPGAKFIQLDASPYVVMGDGRSADVYVHTDATLGVTELHRVLQERGVHQVGYRTPDVKERLATAFEDNEPYELEPNTLDPRDICHECHPDDAQAPDAPGQPAADDHRRPHLDDRHQHSVPAPALRPGRLTARHAPRTATAGGGAGTKRRPTVGPAVSQRRFHGARGDHWPTGEPVSDERRDGIDLPDGALRGVRVLDLGQFYNGSYCGLDAGERDGFLEQWLSFRRLVRRMEHARSPAGRPHDTPTPEAIERAMRRQRRIMRDEAVDGLVVTRRYVDEGVELTAAYRSDPTRAAAVALFGAERVIEMIIAWQTYHDGAGHERPALGRAEAQRMADAVGPTHPRASAVHFAALDDGRAVTAVMALAAHRILNGDLVD